MYTCVCVCVCVCVYLFVFIWYILYIYQYNSTIIYSTIVIANSLLAYIKYTIMIVYNLYLTLIL